MTTEQNKSLARRFYEIFNTGQTQGLDDVAAADYIQHSPGLPPGREGVKAFMGLFRAAFPDAPARRRLIGRGRPGMRALDSARHPTGRVAGDPAHWQGGDNL